MNDPIKTRSRKSPGFPAVPGAEMGFWRRYNTDVGLSSLREENKGGCGVRLLSKQKAE